MAVANKFLLAPAGSTGNITGNAVGPQGRWNDQTGFQFVVEVAGATPTVTFKYQGTLDGTTWVDLPYITGNSNTSATATQTVTAVGTTVNFLDTASGARSFNQYRVVTTANTNITFRAEMWAFEDANG